MQEVRLGCNIGCVWPGLGWSGLLCFGVLVCVSAFTSLSHCLGMSLFLTHSVSHTVTFALSLSRVGALLHPCGGFGSVSVSVCSYACVRACVCLVARGEVGGGMWEGAGDKVEAVRVGVTAHCSVRLAWWSPGLL